MSVNLYLNDNVRKSELFKSEPYRNGTGDQMTFDGMSIFGEKGRLHIIWGNDDPIPEILKNLVEEVSCHEVIPQMGHRESGIYRHETAECELTPEDYGNAKREKPMYRLKITAKNLEDIQAIMHKIKTGTISPDESYEGNQHGKTRQQLENELLSTRQELERLREERKIAISYRSDFIDAHEKNALVRNLANDLLGTFRWPLVNRRSLAKKIAKILD
ncbi:MAG: hypothetical protein Q7R84_02650 [bacterium]|nr:hypothetical protein [bacterium]